MARLNNSLTPSENARQMALVVDENDLEELETLHKDLLNRVDQARADGRIFMMGQYVRLVGLVSPEIDRIQRRFKRETLAAVRKDHKGLKKEAKEAAAESAAEAATA